MQEFERDIMREMGMLGDDFSIDGSRKAQEQHLAKHRSPEPATVAEGHKECPKCKALKKHSDFYPSKTAKDGLQTYCKECKLSDAKVYNAKKRGITAPKHEAPANAVDAPTPDQSPINNRLPEPAEPQTQQSSPDTESDNPQIPLNYLLAAATEYYGPQAVKDYRNIRAFIALAPFVHPDDWHKLADTLKNI